jgi:hypothetical protein
MFHAAFRTPANRHAHVSLRNADERRKLWDESVRLLEQAGADVRNNLAAVPLAQ